MDDGLQCLRKSLVKMGEHVNTKDPIGEVFTDADGVSEVQFQVWKNFISKVLEFLDLQNYINYGTTLIQH